MSITIIHEERSKCSVLAVLLGVCILCCMHMFVHLYALNVCTYVHMYVCMYVIPSKPKQHSVSPARVTPSSFDSPRKPRGRLMTKAMAVVSLTPEFIAGTPRSRMVPNYLCSRTVCCTANTVYIDMFSQYGIEQRRVRKGLAQPQAWHVRPLSACIPA